MSILAGLIIASLAASVGFVLAGILGARRLDSERRRAYVAGVMDGAERMLDVCVKALDEVAAAAKAPAPTVPPSDEVAQEMHRRRSL